MTSMWSRLMMTFLRVELARLATVWRFHILLAALHSDARRHASTFHHRFLGARIAGTVVTERRAFMLAARERFSTYFVAIRAFDATFTITIVLFATFDVLALRLTRQLFRAGKIFLDNST